MRLHCNKHGYLDEHISPEKPCPYCRIEQLEQENQQLRLDAGVPIPKSVKYRHMEQRIAELEQELAESRQSNKDFCETVTPQLRRLAELESRYSGAVEVEGFVSRLGDIIVEDTALIPLVCQTCRVLVMHVKEVE